VKIVSEMSERKEVSYKVCVLGQAAVGKTSTIFNLTGKRM